MRTYYIYGKLTEDHLHIIATLSNQAPTAYAPIYITEAKSIKNALLSFMTVSKIPHIQDAHLEPLNNLQSSFNITK